MKGELVGILLQAIAGKVLSFTYDIATKLHILIFFNPVMS